MTGARKSAARPIRPATRASLTLAAICLSIGPLAAQSCDPVVGCDRAYTLTEELLHGRVDRTLATDPTQGRVDARLAGAPPAGSDVPVPVTVSPDGGGANIATSFSQWGSALSAADNRKLERAKTDLKNVTIPKAASVARPDLDVWVQSRVDPFRDSGDSTKSGTYTTYLGADYRLREGLLLGAMLQLDETRQSDVLTGEAVGGRAVMAGPYAAYQVAPNFVLGARAAWGGARDSAAFGYDAADFVTSRMLTEANVRGRWEWGKWELVQTAAVTYVDETALPSIPGLHDSRIEVTRLTTGPQLKRKVDVGLGSVEPFAFFKTDLDFDPAKVRSGLARNTVGGGVMLVKPDRYNIRASADYTESTGTMTVEEELAGRVTVSVPLR